MWRAQTTIAFFNLYGETYAIMQSKTTPGRTHTTFYCAQSFTISMTAFESGSNQLFPYFWQITYMSAKQIDALATGYFCIQIIFLCNLSDYNQFVGSNLSSGNSRNNRIRSPLLNIREKPVVAILCRVIAFIQNHFIP